MSFINIVQQLLDGLGNTLIVFFSTIIFSMPLGLIICFGRMSKWSPLSFLTKGKPNNSNTFLRAVSKFNPIRALVKLMISILRGTPLMLQIIVVFYGPYYIFGATLSAGYRLTAVIIAFSVNYAAYFAEIFRSGIESIPHGQREASDVLGYTKTQTFAKIIFPQMVKRVLPPVTNEIITLVKDTSLAFVITYTEMFTVAKQIAAAKTTVMPLFVAGLFYFIFNAIVAWAMERFEKKLSYYR